MNLQTPQIIYLVLVILGLGMDLANDGKEKMKRTSFWSSLITSSIVLSLLYWGGFFS